jgi:two-component system, NarL family, sensor kinase
MRWYCFFLIIFLLFAETGDGQTMLQMQEEFSKKKDSLIANLKKYPNQDTARVNALFQLTGPHIIFLSQMKAVRPYFEEQFSLSKKLNYTKGLVWNYEWLGRYSKSSRDYTKAQLYFDTAINLTAGSTDEHIHGLRAKCLYLKGDIFLTQENYYKALQHSLEALPFFEKLKGNTTTEIIYGNIQRIYLALQNYDKAEQYIRRELAYVAANDTLKEKTVDCLLALSHVFFKKNQTDSARINIDRCIPYLQLIGDDIKNIYHQQKANLFYSQKRFDSAYYYYKLVLHFEEGEEHPETFCSLLCDVSISALEMGKVEEAGRYAKQAFALAESSGYRKGRYFSLKTLAAYYQKKNNLAQAYALLKQSADLNDSLINETNLQQINRLAAVYENEEKEKQILNLQTENKIAESDGERKSLLNKIFAGSAIALLIIGFLGYRNFRHQQKNQQQKIVELEKEKQLSATDAMLRGQDEERKRLAKDLHDGLGGMLSGIKLSFVNMKEKIITDGQAVASIETSIAQLDNITAELRKVAHNLMPAVLANFGLSHALQDFCSSMQRSSGINIIFEPLGEERTLDGTADLNIYRIIQELIANAIRYAKAERILVQLTKTANKVLITIEDNGVGFEVTSATEGMGLENVRQRVQYLKGNLNIDTKPGAGTSVYIELLV